MTDNLAAATLLPAVDVPPERRTRPTIAATFGAMLDLIGNAYRMAYVDPYTVGRHRSQAVSGEGFEDRDHDW
jgi:hypothetical protein